VRSQSCAWLIALGLTVFLSRLIRPHPYSAALGRLIAAAFGEDPFVLVVGEDEALLSQLLARAAAELATVRCRVARISARSAEGLSLHDLVLAVSAELDPGAVAGDVLERTHRLLTETDEACDRAVLLIDHAAQLSSSALRFLSLMSRSGPNLRVLLASTSATLAGPVAPEFSLLQARSPCIRIGSTVARAGPTQQR
jgi:type II secretory pathway predicted ATPase ExeA